MNRLRRCQVAAGVLLAGLVCANVASAREGCVVASRYGDEAVSPPSPTHRVSFVFTGVDEQQVVLAIDETTAFNATLTTEDWSTEFSGATECLMGGRYGVAVTIGAARANLYLEISEPTTIYLSARDGVLTFNVWGPDAPGLD